MLKYQITKKDPTTGETTHSWFELPISNEGYQHLKEKQDGVKPQNDQAQPKAQSSS